MVNFLPGISDALRRSLLDDSTHLCLPRRISFLWICSAFSRSAASTLGVLWVDNTASSCDDDIDIWLVLRSRRLSHCSLPALKLGCNDPLSCLPCQVGGVSRPALDPRGGSTAAQQSPPITARRCPGCCPRARQLKSDDPVLSFSLSRSMLDVQRFLGRYA